jgi:hypothetical protein
MDVLHRCGEGVASQRERLIPDQDHVGLGQEQSALARGSEQPGEIAVAARRGPPDLGLVQCPAGKEAGQNLRVGAKLIAATDPAEVGQGLWLGMAGRGAGDRSS